MTNETLDLPGINSHRSETPVRQLDATNLGISVPAMQDNEETHVWEQLHDMIDTTSTDDIRVAVATADGINATAIGIQRGSSQPIHAIELGIWKAYSETQSPVTHVLVQDVDEDYTPCGRCLQTVLDYSNDALIRVANPSGDKYDELSLNQDSLLGVSQESTEQQETDTDASATEEDESESISIPERPPFIDVEIDDDVKVEFVRLNAPVFHLKYQTHDQTFCGTDLTHRESVSSTEEPTLLDPCKICYGETNRETVEEQRIQLRAQLGERIDSVRETEEDAEIFNEDEIDGILNRLPVETPSGGMNAIELRKQLSTIVVDVHDDQENPLTLSRAEIRALLAALDGEGTISDDPYLLVCTSAGRVARVALSNLSLQHRAGKGEIGLSLEDGEVPTTTLAISPREQLYVFTNLGQVHQVSAHQIPAIDRGGEPSPLSDIIDLNEGEILQAAFSCGNVKNYEFVILGSRDGNIKRTATEEFEHILRGGIRAIGLKGDDVLREVCLMNGDRDLLMTTQNGRSIRFDGTDVRPMGRAARGVKGIELDDSDEVAAVNVVDKEVAPEVLTITAKGYGKRTDINEYRKQTRNGRGLIDISTDNRNGPVVAVEMASSEEEFVTMSEGGRTIYVAVDDISVQSRNTMGVEIMELNPDDLLSNVSLFNRQY